MVVRINKCVNSVSKVLGSGKHSINGSHDDDDDDDGDDD